MSVQKIRYPPEDKPAFEAKVNECLTDKRVAGYFTRRIIDPSKVVESLVEGDAFNEALDLSSYEPYLELRQDLKRRDDRQAELFYYGACSRKTLAIAFGVASSLVISLRELMDAHFVNLGIISGLAIFAAIAAALVVVTYKNRRHVLSNSVAALVSLVCAAMIISLPHLISDYQWDPVLLSTNAVLAILVGCLLATDSGLEQFLGLVTACWLWCSGLVVEGFLPIRQRAWLDECIDNPIIPHIKQVISDMLGDDQNKLLVEEDSEGLRKLQDPSFRIPTHSNRKVSGALSQMDGGSIAIAGPRGSGKSTLLREFTEHGSRKASSAVGLSVYVTAPAEYVPRDFIAEVFQRLCEAYLTHQGYSRVEKKYSEKPAMSFKLVIRKILAIFWLALRTIAALGIIAIIVWPIIRGHFPDFYRYVVTSFNHWHYEAIFHLRLWWKKYRILFLLAVGCFALMLLPFPGEWRRRIGRRKESALVGKALEYLSRLQMDKTITWGSSLTSPTFRGMGFGFSKGGIIKYNPWTAPELVGQIRYFMRAVSEEFCSSQHPLVIGIDEIDRIGSVDHAEKFIGEIKAIFGVERCFFLVAVAEDVGSLFVRRSTAGRSILENAFDDIVVIEPLKLTEAQKLLCKRVPGFIDSFAYLVYALSGGLPRELIRVTRRLVEVNQDMRSSITHPRLEDLAFALVSEELLQVIRAARNQISALRLGPHWTSVFYSMHSASEALRNRSQLSVGREAYSFIEELSTMAPPKLLADQELTSIVQADEDDAKSIIFDLAAFSYFGLTVIDAFSDKNFDAYFASHRRFAGSQMSYEQLAVARAELSVSTASGRSMIGRFRESLQSPEKVAMHADQPAWLSSEQYSMPSIGPDS